MFKRIISTLCILPVNLFILTLTFFPHHHHGEAICFVVTHCHHSEENSACSDGQDKPHSHPDNAPCCTVTDWALPNVNESHRHAAADLCCVCACHHLPQAVVPVAPPVKADIRETLFPELSAFCPIPYLQTFVSRTLGLRAPPVC
ncbi:MAG: hypothetical protein LBR08_13410 [Bacteroidales bacterium]|nr:hypothetical protein [Bacteroidales bacterium]